jgi:HK97 family phage major capsid protein
MTELDKLRKRLQEIQAEQRALLEAAQAEQRDDLNEAEEASWDALDAEYQKAEKRVKRLETLESRDRALDRASNDDRAPSPQPLGRKAPAVHTRSDRPYSLIQLCRAMKSGDARQAEVERRASDEIAERVGKEAEGFFVPYGALLPMAQQRQLEQRNVDKAGTGAGLVATDLIPQEFIEIARNESRVVTAGARLLTNLVGDVDIPTQTGAAALTWLADETTDLTADTGQDFSTTVSLTPKTAGIRADVTRRMMKQGTPDVEDLVREDIRQVIGIGIDQAALNGTGASGQPEGITDAGRTGVGAEVLAADNAPSWANVVNLEVDVGTANLLRGSLAYMTQHVAAGNMKTTLADSSGPRFVAEVTNPMGSIAGGLTINGYPAFVTEQVSSDTATGSPAIIFGNWAEVLIGMWGVLDLFGDPYTRGDRGGLVIRGFQDIDIQLRHEASFSVGTNPA